MEIFHRWRYLPWRYLRGGHIFYGGIPEIDIFAMDIFQR